MRGGSRRDVVVCGDGLHLAGGGLQKQSVALPGELQQMQNTCSGRGLNAGDGRRKREEGQEVVAVVVVVE